MGIDSFLAREQYFSVRVFRLGWASFGIARSASQARGILHEGIACACLGLSFVRRRASVASTLPRGTRGFYSSGEFSAGFTVILCPSQMAGWTLLSNRPNRHL